MQARQLIRSPRSWPQRVVLLAALCGGPAQAFSEDICYRFANDARTAINPAPFNCWDMQCRDAGGAAVSTKGLCAASGVLTYAEASIAQTMHVRNSLHFDVLYLLGRMHGLGKSDARTLALYGEAPDLGQVQHFDHRGTTVVAVSDDISGLRRTNPSTPGVWWHFLPWMQPACDGAAAACQTESSLSYVADTGTASPFPAAEVPLAHIRAWAFGTQPRLCQFGVTVAGTAVGDCPDAGNPRSLYWDLPLFSIPTTSDVRVKQTHILQWQPVKKTDAGAPGAHCVQERNLDGTTSQACYDPAYAAATGRSLKALGAYLHAMGDRLSHYHCSDGAFIARSWQGVGQPDDPGASLFLYYPDICGTVAHAMFHYPETGLQTLPERSEKMIEISHLEIRQWVRMFATGRATVTPRPLFPDPATAPSAEIVRLIADAVSQGSAADRLLALCRIARLGYGLDWHDDNPNCVVPVDAGNPQPTATAGLAAIDAGPARSKRLSMSVRPAAADQGRPGSIYVIANVPQLGLFFLTPGGFVTWSGGEIPATFTGLLQDTTLPILDGSLDLRDLVGTDFYLGYGVDAAEMLRAGRFVKAATVHGPRKR